MSIEELMQGSIDIHIHHAPEPFPFWKRRLDAVETALAAQEYGMRAIVLKNTWYPTAPIAQVAQQQAPGVLVFGSLCLDLEAGGLNPFAVEASARLGAKVIWMPVVSSVNARHLIRDMTGIPLEGEGISLLEPSGDLAPQVIEILEIIRDFDLVLATGHISPPEVLRLVDEALKVGVSKIVATHPLSKLGMESRLTLEQQQQLAEKGVLIEHTCFSIMPTGGKLGINEVVGAIRRVGARRCIISTDFGQAHHPPAPEGIRMFIAALLQHNFSNDEIEAMVKINPGRLLGLA